MPEQLAEGARITGRDAVLDERASLTVETVYVFVYVSTPANPIKYCFGCTKAHQKS